MRTTWISLICLLGCAMGCSTMPAREVNFRMHVINADSGFEGAGALDVNKDGRLDIFCGGFWYEAPTWTKHFVREIQQKDRYYYDFAALPLDVDGDGWTDIVSGAWHNKRLFWVRNPGAAGGEWKEMPIDEPGNIETVMLADINGDGRKDALPDIFNGQPAWYSVRTPVSKSAEVKWDKHELPKELVGPGASGGDINQDGQLDVVGAKGWAEQTLEGEWLWRAEFDLHDPSLPVIVHDVDGDGDMDLIWGMGHDYGVYWLEQERNISGFRTWSRHEIDHSFSQAHVVLLGDIDGDGQQEMVTGKRFYAHETDPGANEPRCLYWYKFDRAHRTWTRHTIQEGGKAGIGTATELVDIDGDGDLDLIAPGKSGLFLFENLRVQLSAQP